MDAFICDATRTPIGRFGGGLASVRPDDLAAHVIRALLARNASLDPEVIDEISFGCANQAGEDNRNVARMAALLAGVPVGVPASTINRLCAFRAGVGHAVCIEEHLSVCRSSDDRSVRRSVVVDRDQLVTADAF